jgi:hypothetical protein
MSEVAWTKMFAFALPNPVKAKSTKCVCGGKNCQTAKKIKCVCRCHSEFHGAANRKGMEPLDKPLGLDGLTVTVTKEAPKPLGDLALSRELSGRAEVDGEI